MAVDSNTLVNAYLQLDPDLAAIIDTAVTGDDNLKEMLVAIFTEHAATEMRISSIAQFLIEWAADQSDSRLVILVFCVAITNMDTDVEPSLAQTLLGIAKGHIKPETEDALVALFHFADALITRDGGATDHFEIVFATGLALLDRSLPLWQDKLRIFALHLAYRGRLAEIAGLIPGLEGHDLADLEQVPLVTPWEVVALFDGVETGRLGLTQCLVERLSDREDLDPAAEEIVAGYEAQAILMQHVLSHSVDSLPPELLDNDQSQRLRVLLDGDLRRIHAVIESIDYDEVLTPSSLYGFTAIRLALALRDAELAEDLLTRRREAGYGTYLDDFFQARVALLAGEATKAAEAFGKCLRAVEFYSAHNRLEFELYLACEVSPIQMAWLGHRIDFSQPYEPPANALNRVHHESKDLTTFHRHTAAVNPAAELDLRIRRHIETTAPCLVTGPEGCGQLALANKLHRESTRHAEPYEGLVCEAVADADLQLLFMGEPGAEPGLVGRLGSGSLVVSGIESASPALQAMLEWFLSALERRDDDDPTPKVICVAASPLTALRDTLRPGLYHRLLLLPLELPPLAERREQLEGFAAGILQDISLDARVQISLAPSLLRAIQDYGWPGNIDEYTAFLQGLWLRNPKQNHFTIENIPPSWRAVMGLGREGGGGTD